MKVEQIPKVEIETRLILGEDELRALHAITMYGSDAFLDAFYKELGTAYLRPYERGLRKLFLAVRELIPPVLDRTDNARKVFNVDD